VLLSAATVSSPWVDGLYQQQQPATTGAKHHNRPTTWISRGLLERASAAMSLTHVSQQTGRDRNEPHHPRRHTSKSCSVAVAFILAAHWLAVVLVPFC
jgi:hypothetical protein